MKKTTIIILAIMSFLMVKAQSPKQSQEMLARISVIEVFPQYLQEYLNYALTIGATSVKVEPGVICIFPMLQKRDSCQIRILEIYANDSAYKSHIASEHFQHYKKSTLHMVKSLDLVDMYPLNEKEMPLIFKKMSDCHEISNSNNTKQANMETLNLSNNWDKTFPESNKVNHKKITFHNRYGITLAADMYIPKNANGKLPAIAVSGPFGAVKEQSSGLYAQTLAERGYLTIAFDPSYTGESGGQPRYVSSPDINTEDFSAAVDFLSVQPEVDANRIGIVGICGWGGMALNAAAIDTRIKGTVTITMYDMSRVNANGYFDSNNSDDRYELRKQLNAQRTEDYKNGNYALAGGVIDPLPADSPQFVKDYYDYYKTPRGYHERSLNSNNGWNKTHALSFINMPILAYSDEIRSAVLMIHGEKAHSCYFSRDAFKKLQGDNKELLIIPGANHTDLYDQTNIIPFDKIEQFFNKHLK